MKWAFQVKSKLFLIVLFIVCATSLNARSVIEITLSNNIGEADRIFTATILTRKCVLEGCRELRPGVVKKEYTFKCKMVIYGKCPDNKVFESGNTLVVGKRYVLLRFTDDGRSSYLPVELRESDSRIVFRGQKLIGVQLYKASKTEKLDSDYEYYRFIDFISEVYRIKEVETSEY